MDGSCWKVYAMGKIGCFYHLELIIGGTSSTTSGRPAVDSYGRMAAAPSSSVSS
jgi:hypothetical protein